MKQPNFLMHCLTQYTSDAPCHMLHVHQCQAVSIYRPNARPSSSLSQTYPMLSPIPYKPRSRALLYPVPVLTDPKGPCRQLANLGHEKNSRWKRKVEITVVMSAANITYCSEGFPQGWGKWGMLDDRVCVLAPVWRQRCLQPPQRGG